MEFSYDDKPELYDQAIDTLDYEKPFEQLELDKKRQVAEIAEAQEILNGNTGNIAGMEKLEASD